MTTPPNKFKIALVEPRDIKTTPLVSKSSEADTTHRQEHRMLKATAISIGTIIAVVTIDWAIMNGYRNYLALPLIALWAFTAIGLIRHMKRTR